MLRVKIKRIFWALVRISGIPLIMREIIIKNKATIICYHEPNPQLFEKHARYLFKHYNFIPLRNIVDAIRNKDWSSVPSKSLVVTLDDGHRRNYKLLDTFKKYNIQPTIYLCSHMVNTNRRFWWKTGYSDIQMLKKIPYNTMLKLLQAQMGYSRERQYPDRQALNEREIKEMLPYVDFQSHTKFHPILTKCSEQVSLDEIDSSKKFLQQLLNRPVQHFSYPNGAYTKREIYFLIKSGYASARTNDWGWNSVNSNPYRLKTIIIDENASLSKLSAQLTGCYRIIELFCNNLGFNLNHHFSTRFNQ